jgi:hypothetical protein
VDLQAFIQVTSSFVFPSLRFLELRHMCPCEVAIIVCASKQHTRHKGGRIYIRFELFYIIILPSEITPLFLSGTPHIAFHCSFLPSQITYPYPESHQYSQRLHRQLRYNALSNSAKEPYTIHHLCPKTCLMRCTILPHSFA